MKRKELTRAYDSIKATDSMKNDIFSVCTKKRIVVTERKNIKAYLTTAAALLVVTAGIGTAVILNGQNSVHYEEEDVILPADGYITDMCEDEADETREYEEQLNRLREEEERIRKEEEERLKDAAEQEMEEMRRHEERLLKEEEEELLKDAAEQEMERIRRQEEIKEAQMYLEEMRSREEQMLLETENADAASTPALNWPCPDVKSITAAFSEEREDLHNGIDIGSNGCMGSDIAAAASGTVIIAENKDDGYGLQAVIYHGENIVTRYAHMSDICVAEGDNVEAGQLIGHIGSSGYAYEPHCHFEILINGEPADPMQFFETE